MFGKKDGIFYENLLETHICSAEELEQFGKPAADSTVIKYYKEADSDKRLFCIDWDDYNDGTISVWGVENDDNYQRFEFNLVPCNYVHAQIVSTNDTVHPECNADRDIQMKYLGNMVVKMYVVDANFDRSSFSEFPVVKQAQFFTRQVDQAKPSWIDLSMRNNLLADEINYF